VSPELSRRVGKLMQTDAILSLGLDGDHGRFAFVEEVAAAKTFDDLPVWAQDVIEQAEKELAAVKASA
jgi:hypothetical protein